MLRRVEARPAVNGIRLVGIDGPSGSGKSTLARRLAELSEAPIVKIDDFVSWSDFGGWWPRFDQQVLRPLLAGDDARYQVRDWANDEFGTSLGEWRTTARAPLMILEGVTSSRQAAVGLAYRIWVQAPDELRLTRGLQRDGDSHQQLWLDWMIAEREFFATDGTKSLADLRVDGNPTVPHDPETEIVQATFD